MPSLLLRFAAPLQSWGTSPYKERTTEAIPTRSGVLGLLGAGLGLPRGQSWNRLHELSILVRVDRPGSRYRDFHTVNPPPEAVAVARGRMNVIETLRRGERVIARTRRPIQHIVSTVEGGAITDPEVTIRHYLADASFIVAVSHSDWSVIERLEQAMRAPTFMTYLGRKACPPGFPFLLGISPAMGLEALREVPFDARPDEAGSEEARPEHRLPVYELFPEDRSEPRGSVPLPVPVAKGSKGRSTA